MKAIELSTTHIQVGELGGATHGDFTHLRRIVLHVSWNFNRQASLRKLLAAYDHVLMDVICTKEQEGDIDGTCLLTTHRHKCMTNLLNSTTASGQC